MKEIFNNFDIFTNTGLGAGYDIAIATPVNTVAPTIVAASGNTLGALGALHEVSGDRWTGGGITRTYKWYLDGVEISGATSRSYRTQAVGSLTVEATVTNSFGTASETSVAQAIAIDYDVTPTDIELDALASAVEVYEGRVTILNVTDADIDGIASIAAQPGWGRASLHPDGRIALVLTGTTNTGTTSVDVVVNLTAGGTETRSANVTVIAGFQAAGWATGRNHYILQRDESDRSVIEAGTVHRKVYVSGAGMSYQDIADHAGVSLGTVTNAWLHTTGSAYGASEALPFDAEVANSYWSYINPNSAVHSHWLLLERGYSYALTIIGRGVQGQSAFKPAYVGAWGTGDRPILTAQLENDNSGNKNFVFRDLEFHGGIRLLNDKTRFLFENCVMTDEETVFQGTTNWGREYTVRNTAIYAVWRDEPITVNDGQWQSFDNRISGIYAELNDGLRFEGVLFDQCGYDPDFLQSGSIAGGQPPSSFSHNLYMAHPSRDTTFINCISMRSASVGAQFRGSGHIIDSAFIDNNVAFSVHRGDNSGDFLGPYPFVHGVVATDAANRWAADISYIDPETYIGGRDWGAQNLAKFSTFKDVIVAHANDPDDATETWAGNNALLTAHSPSPFFSDTKIRRWGGADQNLTGLNTADLDLITVQRYALSVAGTATTEALGTYLRGLDGQALGEAIAAVVRFFQQGFGVAPEVPTGPRSLKFVPDAIGDGIRWDNRINWTGRVAPRDGDSVDLAGNAVIYLASMAPAAITFNGGSLEMPTGWLECPTPADAAAFEVYQTGQLQLAGADQGLTIDQSGGRVLNAGDVSGATNVSVSGGQMAIATGGGSWTVESGSLLHITRGGEVGFRGDSGTATLTLASGSTLRLTAVGGLLPKIEEISIIGAETPAVTSTVALGGTLEIDLTGETYSADEDIDIIVADAVSGSFDAVTVIGGTGFAASVSVAGGTVTLQLRAGATYAALSSPAPVSGPDGEGLYDFDFTSSGTATVASLGSAGSIRVLRVGGGGPGGGSALRPSGGGSGGEAVDSVETASSTGTITITIGAGGVAPPNANNRGTAGGDTTVIGAGLNLTAVGGVGGGGGGVNTGVIDGANNTGPASGGGSHTVRAGIAGTSSGGYGNGGAGFQDVDAGGGGGGGVAGAGSNGGVTFGGNGGAGIDVTIGGVSVGVGGGGGGGARIGGHTAGSASHGGGAGTVGGTGVAGTAGTGGGGGGGSANGPGGGNGGSGRVRLRARYTP